MTDARADHLRYYLKELDYLRTEGAAFAAAYPSVAAALDLTGHVSADPQVERLIEAFAFIGGRLQRNIDNQLPRLAQHLLSALHPQLTAPVPSVAIAQFVPDPDRARQAIGYPIQRGTQLLARTDANATCRFKTAWDVTLHPFDVVSTDLPDPAALSFFHGTPHAGEALRIRLRTIDKGRAGDVLPDKMRFGITGPAAFSAQVYETLVRNTQRVWAVDPAQGGQTAPKLEAELDVTATPLPTASITAVGFAQDEALLPYPANGHEAHRLIQEYFVFPQKFLFFDVEGLASAQRDLNSPFVDLVFATSETQRLSGPALSDSIKLGTVPIINLFSQVSEPVRINQESAEYQLSPDLHRDRSTEIHLIDRVTLGRASRDAEHVQPFYSYKHGMASKGERVFWSARRIPTRRTDLSGTEMMISFHDADFNPSQPASKVAFAHVSCTNRGLAEKLPTGTAMEYGGPPATGDLGAPKDAPPVAQILCTVKPTPQLDPPSPGRDLWRLISHLATDQLSFANDPENLDVFRENLRLYAGLDVDRVHRQINGITAFTAERATRHIGQDAWRGFCRGMKVTMELNEENFVQGESYLFGTVMSHFLGLYASAGSFTELHVDSSKHSSEPIKWPTRSGAQIVV
ncbi:MAG: type VI secretion system baseplate subunit TssF [Pseudomonadota bacterium]